MKPVLALDIDGTLLDYHRHFMRFAAGYFGYDPEDEADMGGYDARMPFYKYLRVSKTRYRQCKLAYRRGELKRSLPPLPAPYPQAGELTHQLRRMGLDLWLCTTRPYLSHDMVDDATRHNLRRNGVVYQGLIWGEKKYYELARTVGKKRIIGVIDDLPAMCVQANKVGLRAGFALREHNLNQWVALGAERTGWESAQTHDDTLALVKRWLNDYRGKQ